MSQATSTNHILEDPKDQFTTVNRFSGTVPADNDVLQVTSLGSGLFLESERKVEFTTELAEKLLNLPVFEGERPLRNGHVTYLINCMKRNTFRTEMVRLMSCTCDEMKGIETRMNGQHCCWARLEMPKDYECPGKITVARYRAKTKADMKLLYATIDRGASRTRANVLQAHLIGTDQFAGVGPSIIKLIGEGFSLFMWEDNKSERQKHDGDDLAFLMQSEYATLINTLLAYLKTFSITSHLWMRRAPIIAAMLATMEKAVKKSGEFWDAVREGVNMESADDPRLRLRNNLMTCSITRHKGVNNKTTSSEEMLRWCIYAWNAYRDGKPLQHLRAPLASPRPKAK